LKTTFEEIPEFDGSHDNTVHVSEELGTLTISHDRNRGYGANQKICYDAALQIDADIIIMLHPDYQNNPKLDEGC